MMWKANGFPRTGIGTTDLKYKCAGQGQTVLTGRDKVALLRSLTKKVAETKRVGTTRKKSTIVLTREDGEIKVITGKRMFGEKIVLKNK